MTTSVLFLTLAATLGMAILVTAWRHLSRRSFRVVLWGLPVWVAYVGALAWAGVIRNASLRPPGIVYVFGPVLLFMALFAIRSNAALVTARRLPAGLLIGAQCFRVAVEIGLDRLGEEGLVPRLMTYRGGNIDILVGLSAPLIAWLFVRDRMGPRAVLAWNAMGLVALANVAARSVLSAPGPLHLLHTEVPNLAVGIFPYTYLAGFFAPLAVLLHILSMRAIAAALRRRPLAFDQH